MAAYELVSKGYKNVSILKGGFLDWERSGRYTPACVALMLLLSLCPCTLSVNLMGICSCLQIAKCCASFAVMLQVN